MIRVLSGFMGCGKSTVGRLAAELAAGAGLEFLDLDEEIVLRTGRTIPEIFDADGEAGFRAVERETLRTLLEPDSPLPGPEPRNLLVSLGGGTLTDSGSRELVRRYCKCIYLRATVETLTENLRWEGEAGSRPMLAGADPDAPAGAPGSLEARIEALMAERAPVYENAADFIIDIDGLGAEEIAGQVARICLL